MLKVDRVTDGQTFTFIRPLVKNLVIKKKFRCESAISSRHKSDRKEKPINLTFHKSSYIIGCYFNTRIVLILFFFYFILKLKKKTLFDFVLEYITFQLS